MKNCSTSKLWLLAYLALAGVFFCPRIANHSEAEDAFTYAREVEERPYREILHPNHRLYHPLAKAVFELSGAEKSYHVLVGLSRAGAVLALGFFYLLLRDLGVGGEGRRFALVAGLALTYGFWRYAHEVEVYAVGSAILLGVIWLVFRLPEKGRGVLCALLIVFALNVHRALGPPLVVLALAYLVGRKDWRGLAFALLFLPSAYLITERLADLTSVTRAQPRDELAVLLHEELRSQRAVDRAEATLSPASVPKAVVGLGSAVVGTNLIMGVDPVYELLQNRLFPYRFLEEERMMAEGWPLWQITLWTLCLLGVVVLGLVMAWQLRALPGQWRGWSAQTWAVILAAGAYGAMIFAFEPGNPEMWLLGVPLFWLMAALLTRAVASRWLAGWVACLAMGNFLGGISLLADEERDYHYVTSAEVRREARPGDLYLLGVTNAVHDRYVNYRVKNLTIISVPRQSARFAEFYQLLSNEIKGGRRVFVHETLSERKGGFGEDLADFGLVYEPGMSIAGGGELRLAPPAGDLESRIE
ncbi:MAG: hypothetical protein ACQKBY_10340 [Verrucomicrobiales bacterium]